MAAYLIATVLSGLTALAYGIVMFDAGILAAAGWYVAGCWAGFGTMILLVLLISEGQARYARPA